MKFILSIIAIIFSVKVIAKQHCLNDSTILTSDSVALYLKVAGKGTPCIFVHGGPGAWSLSFEAMGGNVLEKQLTMYYYDQRGSGRSASANNYNIDRMVEDIENIRSFSGSDKIYLLAHSFGGVLAYKYAEKYGAHLRGLILLDVTLHIPNSLNAQVSFINQLLGSQITADSIMPAFFAAKTKLREAQLEYKMLSDNKSTIEKLDTIDKSYPRNNAFASKALGMPEYFADFTPGTKNVNVPVLIISGTADHNVGPDHYKLFKFPHQQVKIIKGGHMLYYEKNEEFAAAVKEFIKK
ncbi:alpha/beta fold hydrolase [Chitinophaga sp. CF418]|uniref:alpha/beta fold hydrolase n=1 Tax=Chitinophaga sp. CF418 TaxID=1855287 RepID=UPI00091AC11C|nr:alpha/beta hydrolase [Chitinophaga sp. CF418]SHM70484.1 proline iminopeptidase [Chitinophaga sp. CF418]